MALLAVYFFWGTTYLGIRMALEAMPAGLLIGVRFFISGSILLLALRFYGPEPSLRRELVLTALFGLLTLGGGTGALVFSEQWVPSGIAALFVSTSPFWMVGIEACAAKWREASAIDHPWDRGWIRGNSGTGRSRRNGRRSGAET